jgi:nucleoid DNA-binding protein
MSQEELVTVVSERAGVSRRTVEEVMVSIGRLWADGLLADGELLLDDIGDFLIEYRPGRKAVNTETREIVLIPPCDFITFAPAPALVDREEARR